jgi:hypothetical protein
MISLPQCSTDTLYLIHFCSQPHRQYVMHSSVSSLYICIMAIMPVSLLQEFSLNGFVQKTVNYFVNVDVNLWMNVHQG